MRFLTAGESHGPGLVTIVEGMPAGIPLSAEFINIKLRKRQGGYGRGERMSIEKDEVEILSGVRGGFTLGSPIALKIANRDWPNWQEIMSPEPGAKDERCLTRPRPGHADLAGGIKYAQGDLRNILERASARETAARVVAGAVASAFLGCLGVETAFHVVRIGRATVKREVSFDEALKATASPVYCADEEATRDMMIAIDEAREKGDTLGGVFEVLVRGLPPGLGSHVHWDRRLDGLLAQAVMSIPGIKGVEIGEGFTLAGKLGSEAHDEIGYAPGRGFFHYSNRAGGLEGGITNGEILVIRAAMKPIPTLRKPLRSVDWKTKEEVIAAVERSDVCAVPAAAVVGEAMVAWVLAGAFIEKFGGDHLEEVRQRVKDYWDYVRSL
ncbi:MAG: chorismate synthase [Thermanaeromonas sp.]|nr:chorismate synthase [Thermanaeromonas sp.]